MRVPGILKIRFGFLSIMFVVGLIWLLLVAGGSAQQTAPNSKPAPAEAGVPQKANPESEVGKGVGPRPEEAPQVLQQLNSALESLVAKSFTSRGPGAGHGLRSDRAKQSKRDCPGRTPACSRLRRNRRCRRLHHD